MRQWRFHAAGGLVFFLALVLRVALLPTARFGGDEALFFNIGMDIVELKHWPLLGTQITDGAGRLPGPTFLYLMALPLLVFRGPEAQFLFVEVLGAFTAALFWHLLRKPFGERGALYGDLAPANPPRRCHRGKPGLRSRQRRQASWRYRSAAWPQRPARGCTCRGRAEQPSEPGWR